MSRGFGAVGRRDSLHGWGERGEADNLLQNHPGQKERSEGLAFQGAEATFADFVSNRVEDLRGACIGDHESRYNEEHDGDQNGLNEVGQ